MKISKNIPTTFFFFLITIFISCHSSKFFNKNDLNTGLEYHENGKLKLQADYRNGSLHGEVINWDDKENITSTVNYSYGKLHGKWTRFYKSSIIMHEVYYSYDKKNGYEIWYYENGNKKSKALYKEGLLIDGPYKWDINGTKIL